MGGSGSEEVYQGLKSAGYEQVITMAKAGIDAAERLQLDYKVWSGKESQETFYKYASAFANTLGGVLVWGINCPQKGDVSIKNLDLKQTISMLNSWTHSALDPVLPGIEHAPVDDPSDPDKGLVITHIPESQKKPHQVRSTGSYYQRTADSTPVLGHGYVLALANYQSVPELVIEIDHILTSGNLGDSCAIAYLRLNNVGHVPAEQIAFICYWEQGVGLKSSFSGPVVRSGLISDWKIVEGQNYNATIYEMEKVPRLYPGCSEQLVSVFFQKGIQQKLALKGSYTLPMIVTAKGFSRLMEVRIDLTDLTLHTKLE
jgi:hypothetical protein